MLQEHLSERKATLEAELLRLCYRRLLLTRELAELDKHIPHIEGALNENEAASNDAATQEAIDQAQPKTE